MSETDDSLTVEWRPIPPYHFRRMKTQCEEELLNKLGSGRERAPVHPLIQNQRLHRPQTCSVIEYSPVRLVDKKIPRLPPSTDGPWRVHNEACRQLLQHSRRGPRQVFFSVRRQPVSSETEEDVQKLWTSQKRKAQDTHNDRLETVFSTWRALHRRSQLEVDKESRMDQVTPEISLPCLTSREESHDQHTRPEAPGNQDTEVEDVDYLMQKMSYWRRLRQASRKLNKYTRNVTQMLEHPRTEVRVYVCSTPDLVEEREMLSSVTQTEVERMCDKYGIACHFVDLRLGADRLAGDAEATRVIQHEIEQSRKRSLGASFIALLGRDVDRYPTPLQITSDVFDVIRGIVLKENLPRLELMDEYYRLDSNNIPPVYNLQIDEQTEDVEGMTRETILEKVSLVVHQATALAVSRGLIEKSVAERMHVSVTQYELEAGLLHLANPERNALCVMVDEQTTILPDINRTSPALGMPSLVDEVKVTVRDFFQENCPQNLVRVTCPAHKDKDYLRKLHEVISDRIIRLLEAAIKESDFDIRDHVGDISEQLHHVNMSSTLYRSFQCRQDLAIRFHVGLHQRFDLTKPVVVIGKQGVGKSTFMAKLARLFPEWTNNTCKMIVRFLGSSPESSDLFSTLLGLCHQLSAMFGLASLTTEEQFSTRRLALAWWERLQDIGKTVTEKEPLVILLDSVDALSTDSGKDDVQELMLLSRELPPGVILVVSRKQEGDVMKGDNVFIVSSLGDKDVLEICKKELRINDRQVTEDQFEEMKASMSGEHTALLLKLLIGNVRTWPSTFLPESDLKCVGAVQNFKKLFEELEDQLGVSFTKYCLCYLALSRYGISEKELGENLIRNDTFIAESVAERGQNHSFLKGLPLQLKVSKLLLRVAEFTMENRRDGQTVLLIKATQFATQILKRYFSDKPCLSVHRDLGMYFMLQCRDFALSGRTTSASQVFKLNKLNLRILRCVPYHLCRSHSDQTPAGDIIKTQLFCNMHWFLNRALSGPIHEVLMDFEDALRTFDDKELELFSEVIRSSRDALVHDPFHIFVILADTLSNVPEMYVSLGNLARQARECLKRTDVVQLLPRHKGYLNLGTILKRVYPTYGVIKCVVANRNFAVMQTKDLCLIIVDLHTADHLVSFPDFGNACVQDDGANNRVFMCSNSKLVVWDSVQRVTLQQLTLSYTASVEIRTVNDHNLILLSDKNLSSLNLKEEIFVPVCSLENSTASMQLSNDVERCFTLHENPSPTCFVTDLKTKEIKKISFGYMGKALTRRPLLFSDDGRYVVVCFQYSVTILDANTLENLFQVGKENQCLVLSTLTRCNEHVVLADSLNRVTIWTLRSGEEVCAFNMDLPKGNPSCESKPRITDILVSEDDHYLCVGFSSGQFVVQHIPTQFQVLVIQAAYSGIHSMFYLTEEKYFQHVLTCSDTGVTKMWNLQRILAEARQASFPFIMDEDLLSEEKRKLTKSMYYKIYTTKKTDKTFLNGADVTAFFKSPTPGTFDPVVESVSTPDSKFRWIQSKRLVDCRKVDVCARGVGKQKLATHIAGVGVALWDVVTGTLLRVCHLGQDTHRIKVLRFKVDDQFLVALDTTNLTLWDTNTGKVCMQESSLLHCTVSPSLPKVLVLQSTTRETHVKMRCVELRKTSQIARSAQVNLAPHVVMSSDFLYDTNDVSVLVRRRDKSTEIRVVLMEDEAGVICPLVVDTPVAKTQTSSMKENVSQAASVRTFRLPFSSVYVGLSGEHLVLITTQVEVIILSSTSGLMIRKFTLGGELQPRVDVFDFHVQNEVREKTFSDNRRLRTLLSEDGSFMLLAAGSTVVLWSLTSRRQMSQFKVSPGQVTAMSLSGNGSTVVTGTSLGSVQVWSVHLGTMVCSFPAMAWVDAVTVDRTGHEVVAVVKDMDERRVLVLDVKSPRELLADG